MADLLPTTNARKLDDDGETTKGKNHIELNSLNDEERRVARDLTTALQTTPYEIPSRMAEVMPGLYLSNGIVAQNIDLLRHYSISHVLNMAPMDVKTGAEYYHEEGKPPITYKSIEAKDDYDYDIMIHWPEAQEFIDTAMKSGGRVLIHCQAGINRSGALALAFLTWKKRQPIIDSAKAVKRRRYQLVSNANFQLGCLLGKPPARRTSSLGIYSGSAGPSDEFSSCAWTFGYRGVPALVFLHGTFAPVHHGHIASLQHALTYVRDNMPHLLLAGAFFSPCHEAEAFAQLGQEHSIPLADRLAMLRLACTHAEKAAEIPVSIDTWECKQTTPPSLATSVRSFARRAAAAAIRRGLGPDNPVIIWVTPPGVDWPADEVGVDPSLVAVCVVVDKGQETEEAQLAQHLKGTSLEDKVRYVRCLGPGHSSGGVRHGDLTVGIPPVAEYMKERLLWHRSSPQEMELARLVHQALEGSEQQHDSRERGEKEAKGENATATAPSNVELGYLSATQLRPTVWRCLYRPPYEFAPIPINDGNPPTAATSNGNGSSSLVPGTSSSSTPLRRAASMTSLNPITATKPAQSLIVKLFSLDDDKAMREEAEACRRLSITASEDEAALNLPQVLGIAEDHEKGQAALVLEDVKASGWSMLPEQPPVPLTDDEVRKVVRALARLHARHWGMGEIINGGGGGQGASASSPAVSVVVDEWLRPMWRREDIARKSERLAWVLESTDQGMMTAAGAAEEGDSPRKNNSLEGLSENAVLALRRIAQDRELMECLYRPLVTEEEVRRWSLPQWLNTSTTYSGLTVVHGGLKSNKIGFEEKGGWSKVLAIGWNETRVGPGTWDLPMLLATSVEKERQEALVSDVILTYQAELTRAGVADYSLEAAQEDFLRAKLGLSFVLVPLLASMVEAGTGTGEEAVAGEGGLEDGSTMLKRRNWQSDAVLHAVEESIKVLGEGWGRNGGGGNSSCKGVNGLTPHEAWT